MSKITRKEGKFLKKSPSVSRKGVLTCGRYTLGKQLRRAAEVTPPGGVTPWQDAMPPASLGSQLLLNP